MWAMCTGNGGGAARYGHDRCGSMIHKYALALNGEVRNYTHAALWSLSDRASRFLTDIYS
jgi:hypothetical protein